MSDPYIEDTPDLETPIVTDTASVAPADAFARPPRPAPHVPTITTEILPGLYRGCEGDLIGRTFQVTKVRTTGDGVQVVCFHDVNTDEHQVMPYSWFTKPGRFARC